jgi:hypothetical protein
VDRGTGRCWGRLDLAGIEAVLQAVGVRLAGADGVPARPGEPITPDVLRRLMEGYRYVDTLLAERVDIFAYGQSRHLLELNHRVLCGVAPERRIQFAAHLAETERRFYDAPDGGIGEVHEWLKRNRTKPARTIAAGLFVAAVSTPQLFIEGNRRTATLLASYVLARAGLPPLVVSPQDYPRFDEISERALAIDRRGFAGGIALTLAVHRTADFFLATAAPRFLHQAADLSEVGEAP